MNSFEKPCREVSRHPHAPVGSRISGQIAGMHADGRAELHVVRHWRGSILETRWYMGAGSCVRCGDPARPVREPIRSSETDGQYPCS
jgi:hypothetical protein